MSRVGHRFAAEASSVPCARCLDVLELLAGAWHAIDAGEPQRAVCDRCAEHGDPGGYARLLAWRRMSRTTGRNAA